MILISLSETEFGTGLRDDFCDTISFYIMYYWNNYPFQRGFCYIQNAKNIFYKKTEGDKTFLCRLINNKFLKKSSG